MNIWKHVRHTEHTPAEAEDSTQLLQYGCFLSTTYRLTQCHERLVSSADLLFSF